MQANEEGSKAPATSFLTLLTGMNLLSIESGYKCGMKNTPYSENDVVKVVHQLNEAGCNPEVKNCSSGQIANIMSKFYYKNLKNTISIILYQRVYQKIRLTKMWRLMMKTHIIAFLVRCSDFKETRLRKTIYHTTTKLILRY